MTVSTMAVARGDAITAGLLWALAAMTLGNGILMLADGATWFVQTPGVSATGPFNPHLVADVGAAYVGAGIAYAVGARHAAWRLPALLSAIGFMGIHAAAHIAGWLRNGCSTGLAFWTELVGVIVPALLTIVLLAVVATSRRVA
ncbi:hypothetical protein [Zavarzinia sp. CC-PAN008]|uniref:hypothetical protein n=1 Tax=Zavarzinia sp. CC-PAN008 TaxID=3243332 RepID=UPI003F742351